MAFSDFPFVSEAMDLAAQAHSTAFSETSNGDHPIQQLASSCSSIDQRRFCSHEEVLRYLAAFASFYQLHHHIKLGTQVNRVELIAGSPEHQHPAGAHSEGTDAQLAAANGGGKPSNGSIKQQRRRPRFRVYTAPAAVATAGSQQGQEAQGQSQQPAAQHLQQSQSEEFHEVDALVVANGHYSEPSLPRLPGLQASQEGGVLHLHAHNYRHPDQFGPSLAQKTVLVVGASNSGECTAMLHPVQTGVPDLLSIEGQFSGGHLGTFKA